MKRKIALILALLLCLPAIFGVSAFSAGGGDNDESTGSLRITHANMQFASTVYLLVAVDYSEVYSDADTAMREITLSVTDKAGKTVVLTPDREVMATAGFPQNAVGFRYTELGAKNIGDVLTLTASNGGKNDSESITYSLLEYAIKVKATYPADDPLVAVVDALLEFGAEAQKAFRYTGDYMLYDEQGYAEYALVYVSGASVKKNIVRVGSQLKPTAGEAIGANPVLYTSAYKAVAENTVTVKAGISTYFFVGDATRTAANFDFDQYTGALSTLHTYYDPDAAAVKNKITYAYAVASGSISTGLPSGTTLGVTAAALTTNATPTATKPDGGFRILAPGSLTVATGEGVGFNFDVSANTMPQNLSKETYTISISIKSPSGLKSMGGGNKSISMQTNSPRLRLGKLWMYLWEVADGKFYLGSKSTGVVLGEVSSSEFTTFHIVVSVNDGRFIGYDANGKCLGSCPAETNMTSATSSLLQSDYDGSASKFLATESVYLNWSMTIQNRGVVLNRYTLTNGNIFD